MKKSERQAIVKKIIIENEIETQEDLLDLLKEQGLCITQATISRDMKELNIVKAYTKDGGKKFTLLALEKTEQEITSKLTKSIKYYGRSVECAQFLVILHTAPNGADVIANYMDEVHFENVVATIAGYDTLIAITRSEENAQQLAKKISENLEC